MDPTWSESLTNQLSDKLDKTTQISVFILTEYGMLMVLAFSGSISFSIWAYYQLPQ